MSDNGYPPNGDNVSPEEYQTDIYDDEEVPTIVLIVAASIAVLTAILYLWIGGGHNHFH